MGGSVSKGSTMEPQGLALAASGITLTPGLPFWGCQNPAAPTGVKVEAAEQVGEVGGGLLKRRQQQLQHQGGPRVAPVLPTLRLCRAGRRSKAQLASAELQACHVCVKCSV